MLRAGNIFLTLLTVCAIAAIAATAWLNREIKKPGPLAVEKLVYIEPGSPIKTVTAKLVETGAINDDLAFMITARWRNRQEHLKAGEYRLATGSTITDIITLLQSGKTYQHKITIPEGLTVAEIIGMLKSEPVLRGDITAPPAEGSLLPETYNFSYNDTRQGLVDRMQKSMQATLDSLWEKRSEDIPLKTPAEAVTLASIVEKETGIAEERPRVAGVFINRLNKGIPLQSDPTVIYAVTSGRKKLDRPLTYKDMKEPSAYNTYLVQGLPPAPIANPGRESLAAVLNPEKNDYIYFVANGAGGHSFARTLKEHNDNVAKWRELGKTDK